MKICVVTPYDADNYGAMNQSLALKTYLESLGHEVCHLRIHTDEEQNTVIHESSPIIPLPSRKTYVRIIKHPRSTLINIIRSEKYRKWRSAKESIIREYLKQFTIVDENDCSLNPPDCYVVGSDEIWNISNPLFQKHQFWEKRNAPCLVYAASMSNSDENTFKAYPEFINQFINFDKMTVRDRHTKNVLLNLTETVADLVVDPTLLNFSPRYYAQKKENIILLYGYQHQWDDNIREEIVSFSRSKGLKLVSLGMYLDFADQNILCKPEEFADAFASAKYVVTTTFHGSIFSIITRSSFVTYNPVIKAKDMLESFGLNNQILQKGFHKNELFDKLEYNIEYEQVYEKINAQKNESISILNSFLQSI